MQDLLVAANAPQNGLQKEALWAVSNLVALHTSDRSTLRTAAISFGMTMLVQVHSANTDEEGPIHSKEAELHAK